MSYVDNHGYSAGPIRLAQGGSWLQNVLLKKQIDTEGNFSFMRYLVVSSEKESDLQEINRSKLSPLLARTPSLSEYTNSENRVCKVADLNEVVTVGYLEMYSALKPGEHEFDPTDVVHKSEYDALVDAISQMNKDIEDLQSSSSTQDYVNTEIRKLRSAILTLGDNIETLEKDTTEKIDKVNSDIEEIQDDVDSIHTEVNKLQELNFTEIHIQCGGAQLL